LLLRMDRIDGDLRRGLQSEPPLFDVLRMAIESAQRAQYTEHALFEEAVSLISKFESFDHRLDVAVAAVDVEAMKQLLSESEIYGVDFVASRQSQFEQIRHLLFKVPARDLLEWQLKAAVTQRDIERVCELTLKLKTLFFETETAATEWEWKRFPELLSAESWAKTAPIFAKKSRLRRSYWRWSRGPIHHCLTASCAAEPALNKAGCLMFKNVMGIMGDRHYESPQGLAQDLLVSLRQRMPLRNECLAQIVKQLTANHSAHRLSVQRGWNLMAIVLDSVRPPNDIENFLEFWLRRNAPPKPLPDGGEDQLFYVRLLHRTVYLGSRPSIPSLEDIGRMLRGQGMAAIPRRSDERMAASQRVSSSMAAAPKRKGFVPPKIGKEHRRKLERQRMARHWDQRLSAKQRRGRWTFDDESRPGNNWHYHPHPRPLWKVLSDRLHIDESETSPLSAPKPVEL